VAAPFGPASNVTAVYGFNTSGPADERPLDSESAVPLVLLGGRTAVERPSVLAYTTLVAAENVAELPVTPVDESAEPALAPVPVEPEAPAPAPDVSAGWEIANVLAPVTGLLPLDLSALESGVRGVLDRISDLDAVWSDDSGGYEDYLWLGAAVLVAGGVTQAARVHRARATGRRTLGFDSVLARWGEQDVVQPR
jgi:hypothetical protein